MLFILIWRSAKGLGFIQFDKVEWVLGQNLLQYVCRIVALLFLWFAIMSFFPAKLASQHHMMKSCLGENTKAMFACWTSLVALWWPAWGMEGLNHRAMVRNDWIYGPGNTKYCWWKKSCTSWGWWFISWFTGFFTYQLMQDFCTINSMAHLLLL